MNAHAVWNKYMSCYDALEKMSSYRQNIDDLAQSMPEVQGRRILDAGSGTGNLSILLKEKGAEVISLDFSRSALDKHLQKDPDAQVLEGSLEEPLPFESGRFDAVFCVSVLFTLSKEGCNLALREFLRVLKPGGALMVSVATPGKKNSALFLKHLKSIIAGNKRPRERFEAALDLPNMLKVVYYNRMLQRLPDWRGYHRFNEEELRMALVDAGFNNVKIGRTYSGQFFLAKAEKPLVRVE